jgi:hypothetical protein
VTFGTNRAKLKTAGEEEKRGRRERGKGRKGKEEKRGRGEKEKSIPPVSPVKARIEFRSRRGAHFAPMILPAWPVPLPLPLPFALALALALALAPCP